MNEITLVAKAVHAKFSPSGSARWMACSGSPKMETEAEQRFGPETPSKWGAEGSAAHALAEKCLTLGKFPADFIGVKIYLDEQNNEYHVDQTMCDKVLDYVNQCRIYLNDPAWDCFIEQKVSLEPALPIWGTADFIACKAATATESGRLYVNDLKAGHNIVMVGSQLYIYGIGAWIKYDPIYSFGEVELVITQPPAHHYDTKTLTREQLKKFGAELTAAIKRIETHPSSLNPGEAQCKYCRARSFCPALNIEVETAVQTVITPEQTEALGLAMTRIPLIKAWVKGVEDVVKELVLNKTPIPGYKVVEGKKGNRKFEDAKKAETFLKNKVRAFQKNLCTVKMMTPIQVMAALKADPSMIKGKATTVDISKLVIQTPGQPTVVPDSDQRKALEQGDRAALDFAQFANETAESGETKVLEKKE